MTDIKITFILLLTTLSVFGQDVSRLKVEQPLLKNLFVWDNLIIVEKDWAANDKYYVCDTLKGRLTRLHIANDTAILDLAETKSFIHAITKRRSSYVLVTKNRNHHSWSSENLFSGFQKIQKFKLVANDSLLTLVTSEKIYTKRPNSKWQEISIDSILDKSHMLFNKMPEHCLLTMTSLYLGFDKGEWGGSLWEIPISTEKGIALSKGKLILEDNIKALEYSSQGVLWVATGLAHLSLRESGIYRYQDAKLQQVLWSQPSLSLKEKSDLSAFCLKNAEDPFFVASEFGVFKISNENLEEVFKAKLYLTYSIKDYSVGSSPVAMYVDKNNTMYLAHRSLGVFVYTKTNDSYAFRQMTFD